MAFIYRHREAGTFRADVIRAWLEASNRNPPLGGQELQTSRGWAGQLVSSRPASTQWVINSISFSGRG